jgi:mono/diheme cytochrome c family protein
LRVLDLGCPLYPRKWTLAGVTRMSALCQKRTSRYHSISSSARVSSEGEMVRSPERQNCSLQGSQLPLQDPSQLATVRQPARSKMQFSNIRAFLVVTAIIVNAPTAQGAQIGSVEQGLAIARERCAECHLIVKENGRSANEKAPTFARIANIPGMTATALKAALNTSHRTMPNLVIKDDDADSIIAYILSLRDSK